MPLEVLLGIGSQRKISYLGHYILERKWVDHNVIYEGRQGLCDLCTKAGYCWSVCTHNMVECVVQMLWWPSLAQLCTEAYRIRSDWKFAC